MESGDGSSPKRWMGRWGDGEIGRMTETASKIEKTAELKESGHVTRDTGTAFEPEVLAFCCEH
jgi:hypothetical protein